MSEVSRAPIMVPAGDGPPRGRKRFYTTAACREHDDGWEILLDERGVKTPMRAALIVPVKPLADIIVGEWMAQGAHVDPKTMLFTKYANTAIDNVRGRESEIVAEIVEFAGSDLLCYRAEHPEGLVAQQCQHWDPVLAWAACELGAPMHTVSGIVHCPQPEASLAQIGDELAGDCAFALTALHNMTTLLGSALLALAVRGRHLAAGQAWAAAHVDEDWQIARWGGDAEAEDRRAFRRGEFEAACRFLGMARCD